MLAFSAAAVAEDLKPVEDVVELFTSQGCSSCPPADRHLAELTANPDIVALAWHVNYWDYLGWKDTLGHEEATRRQKTYAMMLGNKRLVTPQFVVNGQTVIDGARIAKVDAARNTTTLEAPSLALTVLPEKLSVTVDLSALGTIPGEMTAELLVVSPENPVEITRGENAGNTVTYHNAVRAAHMLGMWQGPTAHFEMPRDTLTADGTDDLVLVIRAMDGSPRNRIVAAGIRHAAMLN